MSRHDHTPPMKRVLPIPPAKRAIPTNHPAYPAYVRRVMRQAEKDFDEINRLENQVERPACKTTLGDIAALIGVVFILALVASSALLLVLWGLT